VLQGVGEVWKKFKINCTQKDLEPRRHNIEKEKGENLRGGVLWRK
jgi:hypothetical protein